MKPLLYHELVPWYRLLDPLEDHEDEATLYRELLAGAIDGEAATLLELGAGAGNNGHYLARHFRCTLTDLSPAMLELSRAVNPGCEHAVGDMRSLRLGRTFDAVLVHDAVDYITRETDLRATAETAFVHTRPGGAALFAPDAVRESYADHTELLQNDDGDRSLRCLEWWWDPDPADDTCMTEFAFLLRRGNEVEAVHDRHLCGLFGRDTWRTALAAPGYRVESRELTLGDFTVEVFVCRRPLG